ncbi:hypothetical protein NXX77_00095 [Phocaeicola dorei]|nr:hypothetical protein [Phocaeicola dorei]
MGFDREPEESFDYLNAVKNGSPAEIARQVERAERIRKEKWDKLKAELQSRQSRRSRKINRWRNAGHRAAYSQKEAAGGRSGTLKKPKRSRGFGMGM